MILSTLAAASIFASAYQTPVAEYMPLTPGTRWTYEETKSHEIVVHVAGAPVDVDGEPAIPVFHKEAGQTIETAYYRVIDDTLCIVAAHDPKKPYSKPIPVLRVGKDRLTWNYSGEIPFEGGPAPFSQTAESSRKGQRMVLGEKRDVVEAKVSGVTPGVQMDQTVIYAKGVGMVEMEFKTRMGKQQSRKVLKLTNFEPAKQELD